MLDAIDVALALLLKGKTTEENECGGGTITINYPDYYFHQGVILKAETDTEWEYSDALFPPTTIYWLEYIPVDEGYLYFLKKNSSGNAVVWQYSIATKTIDEVAILPSGLSGYFYKYGMRYCAKDKILYIQPTKGQIYELDIPLNTIRNSTLTLPDDADYQLNACRQGEHLIILSNKAYLFYWDKQQLTQISSLTGGYSTTCYSTGVWHCLNDAWYQPSLSGVSYNRGKYIFEYNFNTNTLRKAYTGSDIPMSAVVAGDNIYTIQTGNSSGRVRQINLTDLTFTDITQVGGFVYYAAAASDGGSMIYTGISDSNGYKIASLAVSAQQMLIGNINETVHIYVTQWQTSDNIQLVITESDGTTHTYENIIPTADLGVFDSPQLKLSGVGYIVYTIIANKV